MEGVLVGGEETEQAMVGHGVLIGNAYKLGVIF